MRRAGAFLFHPHWIGGFLLLFGDFGFESTGPTAVPEIFLVSVGLLELLPRWWVPDRLTACKKRKKEKEKKGLGADVYLRLFPWNG